MTAFTPERAEIVIEEIATTIRQFVGDGKGLEIVHIQLVRPEPYSTRLHIMYPAVEAETAE